MSAFLEGFMMFCFSLSWPPSIYTSWTSRKNDGKSIAFLYIVLIGDVAGLTAKILMKQWGLFLVYGLTTLLVAVDLMIYYRNKALEKSSARHAKGIDRQGGV